ncbi:MAG TPA: anti-sigma factor antagonist [Thermoclostridium sp.]|nr:anti-sigma factor antagonist [Clostridiaceae bacterium]HOQ76528.1 anti-sigma factor antagonist [Thermoclostridium sp.]
MDVRFKRDGNSLVVMIEGEIDHHTASRIRERIDSKFLMEPVKNMVLDLSRVTFMDSAGIGLILGRMNRVKLIGGSMVIRKPRPEIQRILRMSGIKELIELDA